MKTPSAAGVLADAVKKQIDPMKQNYAKQAAELAEKRLQLDAVEKQYFKAESNAMPLQ